MSDIEYKSDGTPVQQFIWDCIRLDYGSEFVGVKHLTIEDLFNLKSRIDAELFMKEGEHDDD